MEELDREKKRKLKKILLVAVLIAAAVIYGAVFHQNEEEITVNSDSMQTEQGESGSSEAQEKMSEKTESGETGDSGSKEVEPVLEEQPEIYVDVGGAVRSPGVVCVPEGARVFEAVDAAGGVTDSAETKYINMASPCSDGQKIYIPVKEEVEKVISGEEEDKGLFSVEMEDSSTGNFAAETSVININTATSEQLQTLPGIGPSMAERIIEYRRTNGDFESVDDLKNVSGIGDKTFTKFESKICV